MDFVVIKNTYAMILELRDVPQPDINRATYSVTMTRHMDEAHLSKAIRTPVHPNFVQLILG